MAYHIKANKKRTLYLILIYIALITLLLYFFINLNLNSPIAVLFAFGLSVLFAFASYYFSDKIALWSAKAKPMPKDQYQQIFSMVQNLAAGFKLPTPKIYLINDPNINAFATGRNPEKAALALTTGAIKQLSPEELKGVVSHELSHIKNYDIRLMTIVVVLVGAVSILANYLLRFSFFRNSESNNLSNIMFIAGLVQTLASPIVAQLIKLAISRKREYLADATAALTTKDKQALADALQKILQLNKQNMLTANTATAHLYLASPFANQSHLWQRLFSTHPPLEKRIEALRKLPL